MSLSRSARVEVSEAVWASRLLTEEPSPCRVLMISRESLLTSSGLSAANSGLKPLNSAVRSSAGAVRSSGISPPGFSGVASPAPSVSAS